MATATVTMTLDDTEVNSTLSELKALADRFPKAVKRLLDRGEPFFELLGVDPDGHSAGGANEFRTRLQQTEFLRGFMAALGAVDRERRVA